jgi:hypothetical protein
LGAFFAAAPQKTGLSALTKTLRVFVGRFYPLRGRETASLPFRAF